VPTRHLEVPAAAVALIGRERSCPSTWRPIVAEGRASGARGVRYVVVALLPVRALPVCWCTVRLSRRSTAAGATCNCSCVPRCCRTLRDRSCMLQGPGLARDEMDTISEATSDSAGTGGDVHGADAGAGLPRGTARPTPACSARQNQVGKITGL
jgi:hypothetical protein